MVDAVPPRSSLGAEGIRLTKLARETGDLLDLTLWVRLLIDRPGADPGSSHRPDSRTEAEADADSVRDTIVKLADAQDFASPEELALSAAREFHARTEDVAEAHVGFDRAMWRAMTAGGRLRADAFVQRTAERHTGVVSVDSKGVSVTAGVDGLGLVKLRSGEPDGLVRQDSHAGSWDGALATTVSAEWTYRDVLDQYMETWRGVRREITESFALHAELESVASVISDIGEAVLNMFPSVETITLRMSTSRHSSVVRSCDDEPAAPGAAGSGALGPALDHHGFEEITLIR